MNTIGRILIWMTVIAWGFWLGGLMYEMVVITPLWSANLPQLCSWNGIHDRIL